MKKRPGFVSATGIAAAGILLAGVLAWTLLAGPGLFSPGPLNAQAGQDERGGVTSHAALGRDCGACHPAPWNAGGMADACVACHTGIGSEIRSGTGLHGGLSRAGVPACDPCHPDHRGPDAALTELDPAGFPHGATGYSLRTHREMDSGKPFTCADCHPASILTFKQAVCVRCHRDLDAAFMDRHETTYGRDCLPCHDGTGRDGADFDHSAVPFKLTGAHAKVACGDCHTAARSRDGIARTPQDCYACHAADDEHDGAYGKRCEDCHSAEAWDQVTFDHEVFPLDHGSEERKASCETCHPASTGSYTCYGCHEHTEANVLGEHEGQGLAELAACIRCHPGGREAEGD